MGAGNRNPGGPAQQYGGGFFQPGVMTIDPTPAHLKPMQQMVSQALMSQMQRGPSPSNMPTFGSMQAANPLLYGGQTPPPQITGGMPQPNVNPMQSPAQMPTYGDVVSGSRMIRSMQPQYTNQFSVPTLLKR